MQRELVGRQKKKKKKVYLNCFRFGVVVECALRSGFHEWLFSQAHEKKHGYSEILLQCLKSLIKTVQQWQLLLYLIRNQQNLIFCFPISAVMFGLIIFQCSHNNFLILIIYSKLFINECQHVFMFGSIIKKKQI